MTRPTASALCVALLLPLHWGCGGSASPTEAPSQSEPSAATGPAVVTKPAAADSMHDRYDSVIAIQAALVAGDLRQARDQASRLASDDRLLDVAEDWKPFAESMQQHVKGTAEAQNVADASTHLSAAARACGDCHAALGIRAVIAEPGATPPAGEDMNGTMRRHRWAADRMWEGLIGPSPTSWREGAKALAEAAYHASQLPEMQNDEALRTLIARVDDLAQQAAETEASAAQQKVYGELLGSCSGCHQQMLQQAD